MAKAHRIIESGVESEHDKWVQGLATLRESLLEELSDPVGSYINALEDFLATKYANGSKPSDVKHLEEIFETHRTRCGIVVQDQPHRNRARITHSTRYLRRLSHIEDRPATGHFREFAWLACNEFSDRPLHRRGCAAVRWNLGQRDSI